MKRGRTRHNDKPRSFTQPHIDFLDGFLTDSGVVGFSSGFGSDFLTRILLPAMLLPLRLFIAALLSPGLGISTKPKPLDFPVAWSITKLQDWTAPWASNMVLSSTSEILRSRLRMSSFMGIPVFKKIEGY